MVSRGKPQKGKKRVRAVQKRAARKRKKAVKEQRRAARLPRLPVITLTKTGAKQRPASQWVKIAASITVALIPSLGPRQTKAAGHPWAPPNPALFSKVQKAEFFTKLLGIKDRKKNVYNLRRISLRTTEAGPIVTFKQFGPLKGKPGGIRLGLAQEVKLGGDTVAKLGISLPGMGRGKLDWKSTNWGLIFSGKEGFGTEVHGLEAGSVRRYTVTAPAGKSAVDFSYMEPGYVMNTESRRIGIANLQKTLGIPLGKLSTVLGFTSQKGKGVLKGDVDIALFYPVSKQGGFGMEYFRTGAGEDVVTGFLVIRTK